MYYTVLYGTALYCATPLLPPSLSLSLLPLSLLQTLVMVAEGIRRSQEMSEMSHTDADSDAGLPDDSDDLEDSMEVI
jgi:hypothetical protein